MSVAIRNWSPTITWKTKAYRHSYTAVNLIKNRLASTGFQNDGVLATVITMAFGASLEGDDLAWNVHINGLANMIKERRLKSDSIPPGWLTGLIIQYVPSFLLCERF